MSERKRRRESSEDKQTKPGILQFFKPVKPANEKSEKSSDDSGIIVVKCMVHERIVGPS